MKNQNNSTANFNNNNDSLNWLKIEGYKANSNQAKSSGYVDLMWLKVNGYEYNTTQSNSQNAESSFTSVDVFFRTLFLL